MTKPHSITRRAILAGATSTAAAAAAIPRQDIITQADLQHVADLDRAAGKAALLLRVRLEAGAKVQPGRFAVTGSNAGLVSSVEFERYFKEGDEYVSGCPAGGLEIQIDDPGTVTESDLSDFQPNSRFRAKEG